MNKYEKIEREVQELSAKAKALLDEVAFDKRDPTEHQIMDLDWYASAISKLSYGTNRSDFVNNEMHSLISWCDHIHEPKIKSEFIAALSHRPLKVPSWSSS